MAATLTHLGGVASTGELREIHSARAIRGAVARGEIEKRARGRLVGASVSAHRRYAHEHTAVQSHLSAAIAHGWKVKTPPEVPWVTAPRHRKVSAEDQLAARWHWAPATDQERADGVTAPLRTVFDCARVLPFDEALAVADSGLRSGLVRADELTLAATLRGPGSARIRRVCAAADGRAANPLESVLRAICLDVPGLAVLPQQEITGDDLYAVCDLVDRRHRLILEAEGYEYHGRRDEWRSDCRRYTGLTAHRWWVLRFTWEDVMHHPELVRRRIETWLAGGESLLIAS